MNPARRAPLPDQAGALAAPWLEGFAPMIERALSVDAAIDIRLRSGAGVLSAFARLPFDIVAGCTIAAPVDGGVDVTMSGTELLGWIDGRSGEPARRDAHWLAPLPPARGWRRIESVPAAELAGLVRSGAQLASAATSRSGQQALLASPVLTISDEPQPVQVPLALPSALARMGFLGSTSDAGEPAPVGSADDAGVAVGRDESSRVAFDVVSGWLRAATRYGSAYHRLDTGSGLDLLGLGLR